MLSLECQTVYDLIRQIAGEEEVYKIIEADEIIERLPSGLPLSKVQLSVAAPQSEEEKPAERTLYQNKPTKVKAEKVASKGALFVMSLLGSLIGSAIVAIVTVLVIKFL